MFELLQDASRLVFTAKDGKEALDLLDTGVVVKPCLVLLDWLMTGMGGEEFLEQLRTRSYAPDLRVVLVSGYSPAAAGGWSPRVVGFLQKPFSVEALTALLDEYCGAAPVLSA
jgi:CheY-like chemotaxis protein